MQRKNNCKVLWNVMKPMWVVVTKGNAVVVLKSQLCLEPLNVRVTSRLHQ